jgi:ABC-type transport system substrate-binding protein
MNKNYGLYKAFALAGLLSLVLAACAQPTPVVETVVVTEKGETVVVTATPEPTAVPAPEEITDFAAVPADILQQVCEDVKAAVTYDDDARTLTIKLAAPFGPTLQLLSNGWASPLDMEWMVEQGDWDGDCANWVQFHDPAAEDSILFDQENGTGPFTLERWDKGKEVSMIRNDEYWRTDPMWEGGPSGPAFFDRIVYKIVEEWGTRFAEFQAGDLDLALVDRPFVNQVDPMVKELCDYKTGECTTENPNGTFRLFKDLPSTSATDFFFTMHVKPESTFIGSGALDGSGIPPDFFADVHIRKAFAACFDYDTYISDVEMGEALKRNGPIIQPMTGFDPNDPPMPVYDPEKCAEEFKLADLDKDGIPAGEDDNDVWNTGFFMMMAYNTGNASRRIAAELLKAGIESINDKFTIDILALPWPAYLKQQRAGFLPIYRIGWLEDYHHPHNWVQPYLSKAGAYGYSLGLPEDLQNQFDTMIAEAKTKTDPVEANEAYKAIQRMASEYQTSLWGVQPIGRHYEQLWIEDWFYNPTFPCAFAYGLKESADSPDPTTLIEGTIGDPETLDPAWMYDTASSCQVWRLYDPLIHVKAGSYEEFVGQLADTWNISDDGLTYSFHIRDGVKFHQGGDLDAHDAAYAIWRGMLQDRAAGPQWMFWDALFGVETVEGYAIDKANAALE